HGSGTPELYSPSLHGALPISGLTDVDAITLSLASSAQTDLSNQVAVRGIFLAALSNSLAKAMLVLVIGGRQLAAMTLPFMLGGIDRKSTRLNSSHVKISYAVF